MKGINNIPSVINTNRLFLSGIQKFSEHSKFNFESETAGLFQMLFLLIWIFFADFRFQYTCHLEVYFPVNWLKIICM